MNEIFRPMPMERVIALPVPDIWFWADKTWLESAAQSNDGQLLTEMGCSYASTEDLGLIKSCMKVLGTRVRGGKHAWSWMNQPEAGA